MSRLLALKPHSVPVLSPHHLRCSKKPRLCLIAELLLEGNGVFPPARPSCLPAEDPPPTPPILRDAQGTAPP